jgi:hypothetical protein
MYMKSPVQYLQYTLFFFLVVKIFFKKSDGRSIFVAHIHSSPLFKVRRFRNRAEGSDLFLIHENLSLPMRSDSRIVNAILVCEKSRH